MKRLLVVSLIAAGLVLAGCGQKPSAPAPSAPSSSAPAQKVVEIKMAGHMPVGQNCTKASKMFQKEVEEKSNGTIKFTYYPAGQLAMDMKAFDLCKSGGVDMAEFFINRAVGVIPETSLGEVPCFDTPDQFTRRMMDKSSGGGLFYDVFRPAFAKHGLHLMPGFMYSPEHSNITKKPVHKMEDYQGMKLRVSGRATGIAVKSWGAVPTVMSSSEVYTSIQRGTVDGANSGLTSFISRKWYEVADHVQYLRELNSTLEVIVNLKFWNSLTPDQQKIIKEALRKASIWSYEQAIAEVDRDLEFLKSKGLQIVDFPKDRLDELDKMRKATFVELDKEIKPMVGDETWNKFIKAYEGTKEGKRTWKEILQTVDW